MGFWAVRQTRVHSSAGYIVDIMNPSWPEALPILDSKLLLRPSTHEKKNK